MIPEVVEKIVLIIAMVAMLVAIIVSLIFLIKAAIIDKKIKLAAETAGVTL